MRHVQDCPPIAQEIYQAGDGLLGADASAQVELVALIVINPLYPALAYTRAFDQQENTSTRYPTGCALTRHRPGRA